MARTGLYKSEVKKARDALVAQGVNPSVDAVLVALGNTGSKTTIHKYLKELLEEGGENAGRKVLLSDSLHDFVARLAEQLQQEANVRVEQVLTQSLSNDKQHAEQMSAYVRQIELLNNQVRLAEAQALHHKKNHELTDEALAQATIARRLLDQQVNDLKLRLTENEQHRQSLEEKHQHSRQSLEHYRASSKEQRDQDQRRHEQQVQQLQAELRQLQQRLAIKQDEVTRLNLEGGSLVADLSHAQNTLHDQQSCNRKLEQRLKSLQTIEQHAVAVEVRLADKDDQFQLQKEQLIASSIRTEVLLDQIRELELARVEAETKLMTQQSILAELSTYLNARGQAVENKTV